MSNIEKYNIKTIFALDFKEQHPEWAIKNLEEIRNDSFYFLLIKYDEKENPFDYLGQDGGEPEDQSLCRDWSWVETICNRYEQEIYELKLLIEELRNK